MFVNFLSTFLAQIFSENSYFSRDISRKFVFALYMHERVKPYIIKPLYSLLSKSGWFRRDFEAKFMGWTNDAALEQWGSTLMADQSKALLLTGQS